MSTSNAARAVGLSDKYGLAVGKQADLMILDTHVVADALLDLPPRSWVLKRGRITVITKLRKPYLPRMRPRPFVKIAGARPAAFRLQQNTTPRKR